MLAYPQLGKGDEVHLRLDPEQGQIVIEPAEPSTDILGIDAEFAGQAADFIEKYRPALEEFAKWPRLQIETSHSWMEAVE